MTDNICLKAGRVDKPEIGAIKGPVGRTEDQKALDENSIQTNTQPLAIPQSN